MSPASEALPICVHLNLCLSKFSQMPAQLQTLHFSLAAPPGKVEIEYGK